jgi:branched-chain amino acid transport system substrate-binding protein
MKILNTKALAKTHAIILVAVIIIALAAGGIAYYLTTSSSAESDIVFGCAISLSGSTSAQGANVLKGYQLWVNGTNANGGLLGKQVKLVYYDDQSNPTMTQSLYEKLITVDKVNFLLGPYYSSCGQTAAVVAEKYHMVMMQAMNNAWTIYNQTGYNYEFLALANGVSTLQYSQLFQLLLTLPSSQMPTKVAIINTASAYPETLAQGIDQSIAQYSSDGFKVVYQEQVPTAVKDLTTQVARAEAAGAQIIFDLGDFNSETLLINTAANLNYHPAVIMTSTAGGMIPNFENTLNNSAIGCLYLSGYSASANLAATQAYAAEFQKAYNAPSSSYDAAGYRACQILGEAIKATGSLDQDTVRNWLTTNTVQTNEGPWQVDQSLVSQGVKYVPVETANIMQWQNSGFEIVYPTNVATGSFLYPRP